MLEQRRSVTGVRPRGVGFREGVLLAGDGGKFPSAPGAVVRGAEGAVAHAELVANVVPAAAGRGGGEVELVAGAFDVVVGDGGEGAVEAWAGVQGDGLSGGDFQAGAGVTGRRGGKVSGGEFDFVADFGGAGVVDGDEGVGGAPGGRDADVGGGDCEEDCC